MGGATAYLFPPVLPEPAATTASGQHRERALDARRYARLAALITTLPSPRPRERPVTAVAGMSIPDIVATLGITPAIGWLNWSIARYR